MLNYIWLSLIVIGLLVAVVNDWHDIALNKYQDGKEYSVTIKLSDENVIQVDKAHTYSCSLIIDELGIIQNANLIVSDEHSGVLRIYIDKNSPPLWLEIYKAQRNKDFLLANVKLEKSKTSNINAVLTFPPVKFVKLNTVTNDGIVQYAKRAVELAIGLIGIMALWLGIMKIAEASGLIAKLARVIKPITTRLFPDVPAEHPAMGAMIMNISANMLGLANAATPLGLKAMEELNKLNRKLGTATDAMCTFLVINTSNVQLIPATVIAIRAASGSTNPTEILGAVIVATTMSTVIGVFAVKLLGRLKIFRKQLESND